MHFKRGAEDRKYTSSMNKSDTARKHPQFRLKTLFVFVTCVAVAMWLFRPGPRPLAERWSESSARIEEALIDEFGPPDPVEKDLVEKLKELKLEGIGGPAAFSLADLVRAAQRNGLGIVHCLDSATSAPPEAEDRHKAEDLAVTIVERDATQVD